MSNKKFKTLISLILILCLVGPVSAATLHVDDDKRQYSSEYTNIQEAINAAEIGDTITVHPGSYSSVNLNKQLTLTGKNYPIVNGITVNAGNCVVKGLTVKGSYNGIMVNSPNNRIEDNVLLSNSCGISLLEATGNTINNNILYSNSKGIWLDLSHRNSITNNYINDNGEAIFLDNSDNNMVKNNVEVDNSREGLYLVFSWGNGLVNNKVVSNGKGAFLLGSSYNTLAKNTFLSGYYGVALLDYNPLGNQFIPSKDNSIYLNNIEENDIQAGTYSTNTWNSQTTLNYTYGKEYTSRLGNYWSDLRGKDYDNDGIMDTNGYYIDEENKDYYPLAGHWETYLGKKYNLPPRPEFNLPSLVITDEQVKFQSESSDSDGSIASYEWEFGDGSKSTAASPTHTYNNPGKYTVKLSITDNGGESNSIAKVITVEPPDTTPPNITSLSPADGAVISDSSITITVRTNEKLGKATLHWGGTSYSMEGDGSYWTYTVSDLNDGEHKYYVSVEDLSGNTKSSEERSITVSSNQETSTDDINDEKEKLVSKYSNFDWKTSTPTRDDVVQAVASAVEQYFGTEDKEKRQAIVNDVTELVGLYFSL